MTTYNLHFKWTVSRGRDTYGYNICTLLVDGVKVGRCLGGGYDMQGTSFAQWIQSNFQEQLIQLFAKDLDTIRHGNTETYNRNKKPFKRGNSDSFYGAYLYAGPRGNDNEVVLDGSCGFNSIERIANAIGMSLKWNPESNRYKNHTYYTAFMNTPELTAA